MLHLSFLLLLVLFVNVVATTTSTYNKLVDRIKFDDKLNAAKYDLHNHPIYDVITDVDSMRIFTESHVWAVWDFMSLLKRLQRDFTNTNEIWTPKNSAENARFIGEICLSEESDVFENDKHISHFELYLLAMEDIGANTTEIRKFVSRLECGDYYENALEDAKITETVKGFVISTLLFAKYGSTIQATSAFFFGREDPIPDMFDKFLRKIDPDKQFTYFRHYLARHIEVDGSDHGPKAMMLLDSITNGDDIKINEAILAGEVAIRLRIAFWNDIYERVMSSKNASVISATLN